MSSGKTMCSRLGIPEAYIQNGLLFAAEDWMQGLSKALALPAEGFPRHPSGIPDDLVAESLKQSTTPPCKPPTAAKWLLYPVQRYRVAKSLNFPKGCSHTRRALLRRQQQPAIDPEDMCFAEVMNHVDSEAFCRSWRVATRRWSKSFKLRKANNFPHVRNEVPPHWGADPVEIIRMAHGSCPVVDLRPADLRPSSAAAPTQSPAAPRHVQKAVLVVAIGGKDEDEFLVVLNPLLPPRSNGGDVNSNLVGSGGGENRVPCWSVRNVAQFTPSFFEVLPLHRPLFIAYQAALAFRYSATMTSFRTATVLVNPSVLRSQGPPFPGPQGGRRYCGQPAPVLGRLPGGSPAKSRGQL